MSFATPLPRTAHGWAGLRTAVCVALLLCTANLPGATQAQEPQTASKPPEQKPEIPNAAPRGKKLFLTDGTFHIVRSYERKGDRVRYYSIERSAWEEIPASMVNWEATRRDEAAAAALDAKIEETKKEFKMERIAAEVDADASLEIAPGIFLPDPPGLFVLEGKNIRSLELVGADVKRDKGRTITQIFVPLPMDSRQIVTLPGARATFRIATAQPEFFIRTPDKHEPEMELIQAKVKGNARELERISTSSIVPDMKSENRKTVSIERWQLAKGVYRLTLSQSLEPGEYVLAEISPDKGMDLAVWEFGVDGTGAAKPAAAPAKPAAGKKP
jgi:hypothetical protein